MAEALSLVYLISGRSADRNKPGRKINSIIECWSRCGHHVTPVFGGDIDGGRPASGAGFGHAEYHAKWYRNVNVLDPAVRSVSEWRDLKHHRATEKTLNELLMRRNFDIIWERSSRLHWAGLITARKFGLPYVLEWKDNLVPYGRSVFRRQALAIERQKCEMANAIVVESNVLKEALASDGLEKEKIVVAHNATDASAFDFDAGAGARIRARHNIGDDEVVVVYLGSYAFYHDTSVLVRAADELRRRRGADTTARILMVGDGRDRSACEDLAAELSLDADELKFMDPVAPADVPAILSAADIAVLPGSTDIICPIKVQEYMAARCATVVPRLKCNEEIVDDGVNGLLFQSGDAKDLASKLERLVSDEALRQDLSSKGRETVLNRLTWERTWGAALDQVRHLTAGRLS